VNRNYLFPLETLSLKNPPKIGGHMWSIPAVATGKVKTGKGAK